MSRTRVKICGLMRPEDVLAAVRAGADALGFVFAARSPRRLDIGRARDLVADVPAFVTRVGLFQDQAADEVAEILDDVPLEMLQFHGTEPAAYCCGFGLPYLKAVSMGEEAALERAEAEFPNAAGLVLDSHRPGEPGGTGAAFDWSAIVKSAKPLVVAGGLTPRNVFDLVRGYRPWAVDVSSGVESRPGVKERSLIETFIGEVERGNRNIG